MSQLKPYTKTELSARIGEEYKAHIGTMTFDADHFKNWLADILFEMQEETAARVREEMLRPSLN